MDIRTNTPQCQFRGAFIVNYKRSVKGTQEAFEQVIGKGKQIFENYNKDENTVLYVMRNSKDYDAGNFIVKNDMSFQYIPEFDIKSEFAGLKQKKMPDYIEEKQPLIIKTKKKLMEFIAEHRTETRAVKQEENKKSFIDQVFEKLLINVNGTKKVHQNGVTYIEDKANEGLVKISPKSKKGISYVYVKPSNKYEDTSYYAINETCEEVYRFPNTPDGLKKFSQGFKNAIADNSKS